MGESSSKPQAFKVVLQKNYGLYTAGSTISLFGMWAHKLAAAWLAWDLTGSSFWVGFVAFAELIPTLILMPSPVCWPRGMTDCALPFLARYVGWHNHLSLVGWPWQVNSQNIVMFIG